MYSVFILALVALFGAQVNATTTPSIHLLGFFPQTDTQGNPSNGVEYKQAFEMAISELNIMGMDISITYDTFDTERTPSVAAAQLTAALDESIVGIVGASSSSVSMAIQDIAKVEEIPQISYTSTSSALSNKADYPFFNRVIPTDAAQGPVIAEIIFSLGWGENSGVIYSENSYGSSLKDDFLGKAQELGLNPLVVGVADGAADANTQLMELSNAGVKNFIILASGSVPQVVLNGANAMGLVVEGNHFVGSDAWMDFNTFSSLDFVPNANVVGVRPLAGHGPSFEAFVPRWEAWVAGTELEGVPMHYAVPLVYDAVVAFAKASVELIENGSAPTDGSDLLAAIRDLEFEGLTGQVSFDENGDRKSAAYEIIEARMGEPTVIGIASPGFQIEWFPQVGQYYIYVLYRTLFSQLRNLEGYLAMNDEFKDSRVFSVLYADESMMSGYVSYGDNYLHCSPKHCSFESWLPEKPFGFEGLKMSEDGSQYFYLYQENGVGQKRYMAFDDKFFLTQRPKFAILMKAVPIQNMVIQK